MTSKDSLPDTDAILAATRLWMEKAVIGLNLCPFAKAAYIKDRVRLVVSAATTEDELLEDLATELRYLDSVEPTECETTLLIHPEMLRDFLAYNDFLELADATVEALDLTGEIQVASFHPEYQFAGSEPDDIENYSNRSPYPLLHLLREASVEMAAASHPEVDLIPEKNMATLSRLGHSGWKELWGEACGLKPIAPRRE
jgi:hypothetical protein